jgi:hypothetical protein
MIGDQEIEQKAAAFSIAPTDAEKDYVYSWILKAIYARPQLASKLVLKGGQAIRKAYLAETRFSKDLDFSSTETLDPSSMQAELSQVCAEVTASTGVRFLDQVVIKDKNLPIEDVEAFEVRPYFKGFYGERDLSLRAQWCSQGIRGTWRRQSAACGYMAGPDIGGAPATHCGNDVRRLSSTRGALQARVLR